MPTPKVIDLSHWNWIPESLMDTAEAGVWGMIHKITEGTSVVDDKFQSRFYLAREAGMLVGGYHFIRPGDMIRQGDFFLERLTGYADKHTLIACDYEDSRVTLHDVDDFMDHVELKSGRSCVLYSGHVLKEAVERGDSGAVDLAERRLWLAQYASKPELPKGWDSWWLWQYTDRGTIPGVDYPCDLNDYSGVDRDALIDEWAGTFDQTALPPDGAIPLPGAPPQVDIAVDGDVVVVVNGKIVYP